MSTLIDIRAKIARNGGNNNGARNGGNNNGNRSSSYQSWKQSKNRVLTSREIDLTPAVADMQDVPQHSYARVRLSDSENENLAIDELKNNVFKGMKWFVVRIAPCGHEDNKSYRGGYKIVRKRGNPPDVFL